MDDNNFNSNKKGMPTVPLVLSFIVIGFAILYLGEYSKWEKSPLGNVNITDSQYNEFVDNKLDKNESEKIDSEIAKSVYLKYDFMKVQNYYGESFKDIYFYNKDISSEYMLYLAILNLFESDFTNDCKFEKTISSFDIRAKVAELFGDRKYQDTSFEIGDLKVIYDNNTYKIVTSKCSSLDFMDDHINTEYADNKISGGKLIISMYAYLVTFDDGTYNYYKGISRDSKRLGHDLALIDKNSFDMYNLVFSKNISGEYYLESFEKA